MTYFIHEGNMERLIKKLITIESKCRKYGCEFKFEVMGEELREDKDGLGHVSYTKYIEVEAEGTARINNWEFIATIEHSKPMNIIRNFRQDVEVPQKYFTADTYCDHCKTRRYRKDTYIIRNTETGEFKQVGKSCLLDYTHGLSANQVAQYISWFDEIINGEAPLAGYKAYSDTKTILQYAVEAVRMYGYVKSDAEYGVPTKLVVSHCYHQSFDWRQHYEAGFDPDREGNEETAKQILAWASTLSEDYSYKSNLKAVLAKQGCEPRDYGLICSAVAAYNREMTKQEVKKQEVKHSDWFGAEGDKVELKEAKLTLLTSWDSQFGYTYLYKLVTEDGTVFTWKTGKWLGAGDELPETISLKGSIKAHNEFRGVKQTELTRCRIS